MKYLTLLTLFLLPHLMFGQVTWGSTLTSPVLWQPNGTISNTNLISKFNLPPTNAGAANISSISSNWDLGGGFGLIDGANVVSPIAWMYNYGGRNAFTIAVKGFSNAQGTGVLGDYLTPLLQVRENGNVGIGTTSPDAKLSINLWNSNGWSGNLKAMRLLSPDNSYYLDINTYAVASGNVGYHFSPNGVTGMAITTTGNLGIGTTSPEAKLSINLWNSNGWSGNLKGLRLLSPDNGYYLDINTYVVASGNVGYHFSPNGVAGMTITTAGNVGIGTTDPGSFKLAVNGKTWTTEVQVAVTKPPDYVFEPEYHLSPLDSIKTYIDKNKHLPEVPSAKEMEKEGIKLGEMNMLLLKKIEELTLYTIEMNTKMEAVMKENSALKNRVEKIENKK